MRKFVISIAIMILCQSCIRNIDLNLDFESKVAVYGIISPNNNPEIFLYQSVPIEVQQSNDGVEFIKTAEVFISDGLQKVQLIGKSSYVRNFYNGLYDPNKVYDSTLVYSYKGTFQFKPNITYYLEIIYNGKTIKANTTIPPKIPLNSTRQIREEKIAENGQPYFEDRLLLNFDDPAVVINYYKYSVGYNQQVIKDVNIGTDTITGEPIIVKDTSNLSFRYLNKQYIPDVEFSGQNHDFEFIISNYINLFNNPNYVFVVKTALRNYNKTLYDYKQTSDNQTDEVGLSDPFTEPILIKSNIEGGLGIFSSFCDSDPIFIEYDP